MSGGSFLDGFSDGFMWGAIGGAASGALDGAGLGLAGIATGNGLVSSSIYAGQTLVNGGHVTAAGLATSFGVGAGMSVLGSAVSGKISEVVSKDVAEVAGNASNKCIKSWDEINEILQKEGLDQTKVNEILNTLKPNRPDPSTYLSKEYIENHLSYFQEGVTKIKSKAPVDQEGIGLGTFVMQKSVDDDVINQANGDVSQLEKLLGLNPGDLGKNPIRLDIPNPKNIRIPSGNEAGAWDGYWTPGGYTKPAGVIEAVVDPVPKSEYIVTENILNNK